jgi:cell division protein FtsN
LKSEKEGEEEEKKRGERLFDRTSELVFMQRNIQINYSIEEDNNTEKMDEDLEQQPQQASTSSTKSTSSSSGGPSALPSPNPVIPTPSLIARSMSAQIRTTLLGLLVIMSNSSNVNQRDSN